MTYTFWRPSRARDAWRAFVARVTGREDAATIQALKGQLQRAEEELARAKKRMADNSRLLEELRARLIEISQSQIQLANRNGALSDQLQHALITVRLYEAAGKVMDDARSEAYKIKR